MHSADPLCQNRLVRRRFLQFAAAGGLGFSLPRLFQAQAAAAPAPRPARIRSCILLYYYGGPSHLDTYDMKPNAPAEVRGSFKSIATSVPGVTVCEHLPQTARVMHRLAVVRSFHHPMRNHNSAAVEALCGRTPVKGDLELLADDPTVDFPCYGATLSRLGRSDREIPAHVALPHVMHNVVVLPGQTAGFLGAAHNPFQVTQDPSNPNFRVGELELPGDLSPARLQHREQLLSSVAGGHSAAIRRPLPRGRR